MAILDQTYRTITCNAPGCKNTVTFDVKDGQKVTEATPWLKSARVVQTGDGRNLVYCSDPCEVAGITEGWHVPVEKKVIAAPEGSAQEAIRAAAAAAAAAAEADANLRKGAPVKIQVAQS